MHDLTAFTTDQNLAVNNPTASNPTMSPTKSPNSVFQPRPESRSRPDRKPQAAGTRRRRPKGTIAPVVPELFSKALGLCRKGLLSSLELPSCRCRARVFPILSSLRRFSWFSFLCFLPTPLRRNGERRATERTRGASARYQDSRWPNGAEFPLASHLRLCKYPMAASFRGETPTPSYSQPLTHKRNESVSRRRDLRVEIPLRAYWMLASAVHWPWAALARPLNPHLPLLQTSFEQLL